MSRLLRALKLFVLSVLFAACAADADEYKPLVVGDDAPAYQARALDGSEFSLASLKGQPVLLNVWATWCVPCRTEMPALQKVHEEFQSQGLRLIGINIDDAGTDANVQAFLDDLGITFPVVRDPENRVTRIFRLLGVPETILIDADGRIAHRWIGEVSGADVERRVRGVLSAS